VKINGGELPRDLFTSAQAAQFATEKTARP
jgi:hypothetical protein